MKRLPDRFLNRRVVVHFRGGAPWFEGTVIGIHSEPTLVVVDDDGHEHAVSTYLPIDLVERRRRDNP